MLLSTTLLGSLAVLTLATDVCPECCTLIDGVICSSSECTIATICTPSTPSSLATAVSTDPGSTTGTIAMNRAEAPHTSSQPAPTTDSSTTSSIPTSADGYASSSLSIPADYNPAPYSSTTTAVAFSSSSSSSVVAGAYSSPAVYSSSSSSTVVAAANGSASSSTPSSISAVGYSLSSLSSYSAEASTTLPPDTTCSTAATTSSCPACCLQTDTPCSSAVCHVESICPCSLTPSSTYQSTTTTPVAPLSSLTDYTTVTSTASTTSSQSSILVYEHNDLAYPPVPPATSTEKTAPYLSFTSSIYSVYHDVDSPALWETAYDQFHFASGDHDGKHCHHRTHTGDWHSGHHNSGRCRHSFGACHPRTGLWDGPQPTGRSHHCHDGPEEFRANSYPSNAATATSTLLHAARDVPTISTTGPPPKSPSTCPDCCYSDTQCDLSICAEPAICPRPKSIVTTTSTSLSSSSSSSMVQSSAQHYVARDESPSPRTSTVPSSSTTCPDCCYNKTQCDLSLCVDRAVCPYPRSTTTSGASETSSISSVTGAPSFTTHINLRRNDNPQASAAPSTSKPAECPTCCYAFAKCALSWCEDLDICPIQSTVSSSSNGPQPTTFSNVVIPRARNM